MASPSCVVSGPIDTEATKDETTRRTGFAWLGKGFWSAKNQSKSSRDMNSEVQLQGVSMPILATANECTSDVKDYYDFGEPPESPLNEGAKKAKPRGYSSFFGRNESSDEFFTADAPAPADQAVESAPTQPVASPVILHTKKSMYLTSRSPGMRRTTVGGGDIPHDDSELIRSTSEGHTHSPKPIRNLTGPTYFRSQSVTPGTEMNSSSSSSRKSQVGMVSSMGSQSQSQSHRRTGSSLRPSMCSPTFMYDVPLDDVINVPLDDVILSRDVGVSSAAPRRGPDCPETVPKHLAARPRGSLRGGTVTSVHVPVESAQQCGRKLSLRPSLTPSHSPAHSLAPSPCPVDDRKLPYFAYYSSPSLSREDSVRVPLSEEEKEKLERKERLQGLEQGMAGLGLEELRAVKGALGKAIESQLQDLHDVLRERDTLHTQHREGREWVQLAQHSSFQPLSPLLLHTPARALSFTSADLIALHFHS